MPFDAPPDRDQGRAPEPDPQPGTPAFIFLSFLNAWIGAMAGAMAGLVAALAWLFVPPEAQDATRPFLSAAAPIGMLALALIGMWKFVSGR